MVFSLAGRRHGHRGTEDDRQPATWHQNVWQIITDIAPRRLYSRPYNVLHTAPVFTTHHWLHWVVFNYTACYVSTI